MGQENRIELPGGHIHTGEHDLDGLRRKLDKQLLPLEKDLRFFWKFGDLLGVFFRPSHRRFIYPYLPSHVSSPKETIKIYIIQLPEKCVFSIPENQTIVAVPIFDFFDNAIQWGNVFSSIPTALSRLDL